jgi:hypothetical protein
MLLKALLLQKWLRLRPVGDYAPEGGGREVGEVGEQADE